MKQRTPVEEEQKQMLKLFFIEGRLRIRESRSN